MRLSCARPADVAPLLKRFLSSRGEILADERSNTLIIRDIPGVFPDVDNLIKQLDRRTQQVEIEARVVAATRTFARDIGTQFGFATSSTGGRSVYGGASSVGTSSMLTVLAGSVTYPVTLVLVRALSRSEWEIIREVWSSFRLPRPGRAGRPA